MLSPYSWLSMALALAKMVLDVQKNKKKPSLSFATTFASTTVSRNQSPGMFGFRSYRNLLAPPTLIRTGNPGCSTHSRTLGVKTNPLVPHT